MKVHLDTDIGGDIDDLCALAMLLKWPGLEITGITTVAEEQGRRAGYVRYVLNSTERADIPFAAGADLADGYFRYSKLDYPPDAENWPEPVAACPGPLGDALSLLKHSVDQGAVIVCIGPFTNLLLLDHQYPGILKQARLFLMGGYAYPPPVDFPQWDNSSDYNIQTDVRAAKYILENANPTLIPLTVSCQTALRQRDLSRLVQAGRLGELLVRQAELFARTESFEQKYGLTCPALPPDIINFHHDPLACAIALGWREGVQIETIPLRFDVRDGWLHEVPDADGIPTPLVTRIDGELFNNFWCDTVCD